MAIHRTKIQKQQAAEKRKLEYAYQPTDEMVQPGLVNEHQHPRRTESTPVERKTIKPLESGLAHHSKLTAAYLVQDLRRTMIVTLLLGVLLIGIWLATRYNGVSSVV